MKIAYKKEDPKPYKVEEAEYENYTEAKAHIDAAVTFSELDEFDLEDLINYRQ